MSGEDARAAGDGPPLGQRGKGECERVWVMRLAMVASLVSWAFLGLASGPTLAEQAASSTLARNPFAGFSVSLVPTVPVPIRIGTHLGFRLSSSTAGYANLYLIDPVGEVWVLAENMPLAAGSLEYPSSAQQFTLAAAQPVGFNRVILLVTRQPFAGFGGNATLTRPVSLAVRANVFVPRVNRAAGVLPRDSWAADEIRVRIVG